MVGSHCEPEYFLRIVAAKLPRVSFSVQIVPDMIAVEAGATQPASVVIENRGSELDRFEMDVEGIDPEWKAVPVPSFAVEPGERRTEKVFIKPPRASESLAGNYPFVVRVRSLVSGETRTAQGVIALKPFHHISMEITPRKGFVSAGRKQNTFLISIVNLGNTEHRLHLVGNDPEDICAFEFEQEHVAVMPGQQKELEVTAIPTSSPLFSTGRLIGFAITARSEDAPNVVASAQAQLEQRPVFTPASVAMVLLLALLIGGWLLMAPKPPGIVFSVNPSDVTQGDEVTLIWTAHDASSVTVMEGDKELYSGPNLTGRLTVATKDQSGTIDFRAWAGKEGRKSDVISDVVNVNVPEKAPPPQIIKFYPEQRRVKVGQPVTLRYSLANATRAVLGPEDKELDLQLDRIEVTPPAAGPREYTLVVYNKDGVAAKQSIRVDAYEESDATILNFVSDTQMATEDDFGRVTLTWQVTNSARVELKTNDSPPVVVDPSGTKEFNINAKTTFTLTAYDAKGRTRVKSLTVLYKARSLPNPNEGTTGVTTGGTTSGPTTDTSTTDGGTP